VVGFENVNIPQQWLSMHIPCIYHSFLNLENYQEILAKAILRNLGCSTFFGIINGFTKKAALARNKTQG